MIKKNANTTYDNIFIISSSVTLNYLHQHTLLTNSLLVLTNERLFISAPKNNYTVYVSTGSPFSDRYIILSYIKLFKPVYVFSDIEEWLNTPLAQGVIKLSDRVEPVELTTYLKNCKAWIATTSEADKILQPYPILALNRAKDTSEAKCLHPLGHTNQPWSLNLLNSYLKTGLMYQSYNQHPVITWPPQSLKTRSEPLPLEIRGKLEAKQSRCALLKATEVTSEYMIILSQIIHNYHINKIIILECSIVSETAIADYDNLKHLNEIVSINYQELENSISTLLSHIHILIGNKDPDLEMWSGVYSIPYFDITKHSLVIHTNPFEQYHRLIQSLLTPETQISPSLFPEVSMSQTNDYSNSLPFVSVIIPCYNYGNFLHECVDSVINQTYKNLELIIINDGSHDNTKSVCQEILNHYPSNRIIVIEQPNSGDPAIARNHGIGLAQGEWILCLDADDKVNPEFIQACLSELQEYPELGIIYPRVQEFGNSQALWNYVDYDIQLLSRINIIPTASLFRKQIWQEVGGIKPGIIICEDWDFWLSCCQVGCFGKQAKAATLYHRVHEQGSLLDTHGQLQKREQIKASIILRHYELYSPQQQKWAYGIRNQNINTLSHNLDISWMPIFYGERTPDKVNQLHQDYLTLLANSPLHIVQERTYTNQTHQWWQKRHGYWQQLKTVESILDWHPTVELLPDEIVNHKAWVATSAAQARLRQLYPDLNIDIVPRFCSPLPMPSSLMIDTEKSYQLLFLLEHANSREWQELLYACIQAYKSSDDIALLLLFLDTDTETSYESLSIWLENQISDTPEMVILDPRDFNKMRIWEQIQPQAIYCQPTQDLSGEIWLDTLQNGSSLLFKDPIPPEYLDVLDNTKDPVISILQQNNPSIHAVQGKSLLPERWNQYVWRCMNHDLPPISWTDS